MSRTYRRSAYTDACSKVHHINRAVDRHRRYALYLENGYRFYRRLLDGVTEQDTIEHSKKEYMSYSRDGSANETARNRGFKEFAKLTVRLANKRLEDSIMRDEEDDSVPYPSRKMGKKHIWDWW